MKKLGIILSVLISALAGVGIYALITAIKHNDKMIDEDIRQWYRTNIGY